tara:strand:- start:415 stop:669 length:255 start_codon:yes stop_codon:yes gene_type:complete
MWGISGAAIPPMPLGAVVHALGCGCGWSLAAGWLAWASPTLLWWDEGEAAPSCCAGCRCFSPRPRRRDGAATVTWAGIVDAIES